VPGIRIDWTFLESAFESHAPDIQSWLHRETGESIVVSDASPPADRERVEGKGWIKVEPVPSREQYRMMERFIETVTHAQLKERLMDSIVGKGAFRRFKDTLSRYPEERKRWFAFRDVLLHHHILDWLKEQQLEILERAAWSLELPTTPSPQTAASPISEEGAPVEAGTEQLEHQEQEELRSYLLAWARSHGEEYHYLFGPAAFARLAIDMAQEFNVFRRRSATAG
jgi:hypothetical protein